MNIGIGDEETDHGHHTAMHENIVIVCDGVATLSTALEIVWAADDLQYRATG
jgi:hypothetical protein